MQPPGARPLDLAREFDELKNAGVSERAQGSFVRLYAKWPRVAGGTADGYLRTTLVQLFLDTRWRGRAKERLVAETPERSEPSRDLARVDDQQSLLAAPVDGPEL